MKNALLSLVLLLFCCTVTKGQTIIVNNGTTFMTLSGNYENAEVEENTPVVISNTNTVNISGNFHAYGTYDEAGVNSYDIAIIAKPNTSIGIVKKLPSELGDPKNGTTVIRTSTGGAGIQGNPKFIVFPNPVSEMMNVKITDGSIISYKIYDFQAALVLSGKPENKNSFSVYLTALPKGTYFLKLEMENGESTSVQFIKN